MNLGTIMSGSADRGYDVAKDSGFESERSAMCEEKASWLHYPKVPI